MTNGMAAMEPVTYNGEDDAAAVEKERVRDHMNDRHGRYATL